MWADLKMNHVNASRTRGEMIVIVLAAAAIAVLLWTITSLAREQVHKAEMRDALRNSQRVAMARCWQDSPNASAMRSCMADVRVQTARALDESYGLPASATAVAEVPVLVSGDVSLVSLKY